MKGTRNPATAREDKQLLAQIATAQTRLYEKLMTLDLQSSGISEYNQWYLRSKLATAKIILHLYGRLLYFCLTNSEVSIKDFTLVDYGGGSGLISLLAVELGIGTVVYNDIYDVSCNDAYRLSNIFGLVIDAIVCGDIDDLVAFLNGNDMTVNAIVSYDVLEHIYDVKTHFQQVRLLSQEHFRIVYASGANIENRRRVKAIKTKQIAAEHRSREKEWGHKERDELRAFIDVRMDMIADYAPSLSPEEVRTLAQATRGLMRRDIERSVEEWNQRGQISYQIDHPTNTCDPYTGNWCEHLMDLEWLEGAVRRQGFRVRIFAGLYYTCGTLPKRTVKRVLNAGIRRLGRRGMVVAPYFVLYAEPSEKGAEVAGRAAVVEGSP